MLCLPALLPVPPASEGVWRPLRTSVSCRGKKARLGMSLGPGPNPIRYKLIRRGVGEKEGKTFYRRAFTAHRHSTMQSTQPCRKTLSSTCYSTASPKPEAPDPKPAVQDEGSYVVFLRNQLGPQARALFFFKWKGGARGTAPAGPVATREIGWRSSAGRGGRSEPLLSATLPSH